MKSAIRRNHMIDISKGDVVHHPHNQYHWHNCAGGEWRIGFGVSSFLVAEGSAWSRPIGRALFLQLRALKRGRQIWPGTDAAALIASRTAREQTR